jgi:UDP-N-acetylglucosamine 4-epimerase
MIEGELYRIPYHEGNLNQYKFLITGGAGFIGSNLVEYLLKFNAGHVRVLDNLSNGYFDNIKSFIDLPNFEFIQGDIRDIETCKLALEGIHYVSHQAALGSVPRSINNPILTNEVNISGFLNVLAAAKDQPTVKRMVYAASSSTYGDSPILPKTENVIGKPLSPYAVTKLVNEIYADVFSKVYGFHTVGLRYFNVFGPNQRPDNPYAAVIPLFIKAAGEGKSPVIFGDGETSRDFTFVENVVQANIKSLLKNDAINESIIFNIACGSRTSLNDLWKVIARLSNVHGLKPDYLQERSGDIRHSLADITKAVQSLNYDPSFDVEKGLSILIESQRLAVKKID